MGRIIPAGLGVIVAVVLFGPAVPVATAGGTTVQAVFDRVPADEVSPSGNSVMADCTDGEAAGHVREWPQASATLSIEQRDGTSRVDIRLRRARPHTYYTVWLRLGGVDSAGVAYGTSPLTGAMGTPLASTTELPALLESTGAANGNDHQPNGFTTDRRGGAMFSTVLDFPVVAGAYPFQRFPGFDPSDPRLPAEDPAIRPVAIAGPQGAYTIRIVSHCTDGIGHGLTPGARERWFDWTVDR